MWIINVHYIVGQHFFFFFCLQEGRFNEKSDQNVFCLLERLNVKYSYFDVHILFVFAHKFTKWKIA